MQNPREKVSLKGLGRALCWKHVLCQREDLGSTLALQKVLCGEVHVYSPRAGELETRKSLDCCLASLAESVSRPHRFFLSHIFLSHYDKLKEKLWMGA